MTVEAIYYNTNRKIYSEVRMIPQLHVDCHPIFARTIGTVFMFLSVLELCRFGRDLEHILRATTYEEQSNPMRHRKRSRPRTWEKR
jgi:hypothetical protein